MTSTLDLTRRIDLLRERRQELDLATPGEVVLEQRQVLRRACLWGAGAVAAVAALGFGILFFQFQATSDIEKKVLPVEADLASTQSELEVSRAALQKQRNSNSILAKALAATPSGAALMRDLQERVPEGVQLSDLKRSGSGVTVAGLVQDPVSFVRLNTLELQLAQSPLLSQPKLVKATRNPPEGGANASVPGKVAFEIQAQLRDLAADPATFDTLRRLGADGLVKRLQLLRKEGLMP
jgi:Tfp pilus assembly protein PilN